MLLLFLVMHTCAIHFLLYGRLNLSVGFHPSFSYHGKVEVNFTLFIWLAENIPPLEDYIVTIDISVATSHLGIHPAFHHLATPHIVGKRSQEQGVTTETTEHGAQLSEVRAQQGIGLPLRHFWRIL